MTTEELRIPAQYELAATLRRPKQDQFPLVLLLHGWRSNRNTERNVIVGEMLAQRGIGSIAFDFRGHGDSGGDITLVSVDAQVQDTLAVWMYCFQQIPGINRSKIGIVGASIGGTTALQFLSEFRYACSTAVLIAPRLNFAGVRRDMYSFDTTAGRVENHAMLPHGQSVNFYTSAREIRVPTLIIHGTKDEFIPIEQSRKLAARCPQFFTLREIPNGGHVLGANHSVIYPTVQHLVDHLSP